MKRVLVLCAFALLAMGKKPKGVLLWEGTVKSPAPFESFEILEIDGKQELLLSRGKETCRFPLGTFNVRDTQAFFDGAKVGGCKAADVLRASGEVSAKGGTIRLLGGKDPIDLVLADVTRAK